MSGTAERAAPLPAPDAWFSFARGGRSLEATGIAARVIVPAGPDQVARAAVRAREALASVPRTDDGPPPLIVGALPFDGTAPATLVVPEQVRIHDDPAGDDARRSHEADGPGRLRVEAVPAPAAYTEAVARAVARIGAGDLRKVVLARMLLVHAERPFSRALLIARLRARNPDAFTFAAGGFVGASPELLVSRRGDAVASNPLAGTIGAAVPGAPATLLDSTKDREEHDLVVDAVRTALGPVCAALDVDPEPAVRRAGPVLHLSTWLRGTLRAPAPDALTLAGLLHPTPAVCGTPRDAARDAIRELEGIDRTLYAGIVGWMDANGDGEWAVALRCAEVQGRLASLFAGAGIVAGSVPDAELAETDAKFEAMLAAIGLGGA